MLVAVAAEPESATEASDAELAGRVRGGDRATEAELFRRLAPRVRLYGLRHLRDPAAADDLDLDRRVSAWSASPSASGPSSCSRSTPTAARGSRPSWASPPPTCVVRHRALSRPRGCMEARA
jgi:hypothetical protein